MPRVSRNIHQKTTKKLGRLLALRYSNKQLILASRLRALLDAETIKRKSAGQLSNLVDSY